MKRLLLTGTIIYCTVNPMRRDNPGTMNVPPCFHTIRKKKGFWLSVLLYLVIFLLISNHPVQAQTPTPEPHPGVPPGFYPIDSALGVWLFKKDYPKGNPDFVQWIDLTQGARLELMHGELTELRETKGVYGGADPRMTSIPIQNYWQSIQGEEQDAFCATNGQFFYMPEYPTRLSFPIKVNGVVVTDGWGINTYIGHHLILQLWDDRADIVELNQESLYGSDAPNAIGGLTEEANKRAKFSVGRTFIGINDRDQDGSYETILIFNTLSATQAGAAESLRSFGAKKVMMLDGGGSTQLICRSGWHIRSDRPVPQAIAIIAGTPPPVSSEISSKTEWPILLEGELLPLELKITNTGIISWTAETTSFVVHSTRVEFQEIVPLEDTVQPGETTEIQLNMRIANQTGVISVEVQPGISHEGKVYAAKPFHVRAIVLPFQLNPKKNKLRTQLQLWKNNGSQDIEQQANAWIEREMSRSVTQVELNGIQQVQPMDAALVPLLMLPGLALIAWLIARTRH